MKKFSLLIILTITIYSLTSCSANRGNGCGYWSATAIPQPVEKQYTFPQQEDSTCTNVVTTD